MALGQRKLRTPSGSCWARCPGRLPTGGGARLPSRLVELVDEKRAGSLRGCLRYLGTRRTGLGGETSFGGSCRSTRLVRLEVGAQGKSTEGNNKIITRLAINR